MHQPRPRPDRGTVLLLFPASVLIVFLLGAIVVDVGLAQLRARELEAVAAAIAFTPAGAQVSARKERMAR